MTKFQSIYKQDGHERTIGVHNTRKEAINALINASDDDYCLDTKEERIQALEDRDWYTLGCGPNQIGIVEVEQ